MSMSTRPYSLEMEEAAAAMLESEVMSICWRERLPGRERDWRDWRASSPSGREREPMIVW